MSQTIDLRKKDEPVELSQPAEEVLIPAQTTSWTTHLAPPPNRERVWYVVVGLVIAAVLVAFFIHDILFTIILILAAVILILNMFRPHHPSHVTVHATGVSVDDEHHHYADMKSFWIEYQPYMKELSIEFKKGHMPRMRIPLQDTNPLEIRQAMISYVPEKEHEISLLDHIIRHIGI